MDPLFESASWLTTTGATVVTGLDALPHALLFYRQELQWLGGMGVVVLGLAVIPLLGIGGMQLCCAEAPGPLKEEKLTPRLVGTARSLWLPDLGLTLACALGYWPAGMDAFDAVAHSLSAVSTGGFSTHDASLGRFQSPAVEAVAIAFMLLAAINNLGPGLGEVACTFQGVRDAGKLVAVAAMLLGQLEIFTILVLLTPGFWRG